MPHIALLVVALALSACTATGGSPFREAAPIDQIRFSSFPMAQDVWRVSVRSNGRVERELVEHAALYRAAELTLARGYQRFIVQSATLGPAQRSITQTLTQTGQAAGAATNLAVPGAGGLITGGTGAVVGGLDSIFTSYGGDILIKMFREGDPAAVNALVATEMLSTHADELRRTDR